MRPILILLAIAAARPAAAQEGGPALLARGQAALDELRYEEAASLFDRAWRAGGNRPEKLALLFRLSGEVAVTLGDDTGAEAAFRRLLALEPDAALPEGTSPKIAARLDAARAALAGQGPLRIEVAQPTAGPDVRLTVEVRADPLQMVAGLRASYRGVDGVARVREATGPGPLAVALASAEGIQVRLEIVDRHGNILVEESVATLPPRAPPPRRAAPPPPPSIAAEEERPFLARPLPWAAAAAGLGAVGLLFGLQSESDQNQLDELNRTSSDHDFRDALAVEDRLHRDTLIANIGLAGAGAAAVVAVVLWVREPRRTRRASLVASPAAISWTLAF